MEFILAKNAYNELKSTIKEAPESDDNMMTSDVTSGPMGEADASKTSWGVLAFTMSVYFIIHVVAVIEAASGSAKTQQTDIILAVVSPIVFFILKWCSVVALPI